MSGRRVFKGFYLLMLAALVLATPSAPRATAGDPWISTNSKTTSAYPPPYGSVTWGGQFNCSASQYMGLWGVWRPTNGSYETRVYTATNGYISMPGIWFYGRWSVTVSDQRVIRDYPASKMRVYGQLEYMTTSGQRKVITSPEQL